MSAFALCMYPSVLVCVCVCECVEVCGMRSILGGRRCGGPAISGESGRRSDARTFQAAPQSIEIRNTVQGAAPRSHLSKIQYSASA